MKEVWKNIIGYEEFYQVSNMGRIKILPRRISNGKCVRTHSEKIKKAGTTKTGYKKVHLTKDNKQRTFSVHRIVALHFIKNDNPKFNQINHIDGNKSNNCANNLEWCTSKQNIAHASKNGLRKYVIGESHGLTYITSEDVSKIRKHKSNGMSGVNISILMPHIKYHVILSILSGRTWKHVAEC